MDDAHPGLRQSSWDNLTEKAQVRGQATVHSNKGRPHKLVHMVESTEVSNSQPDQEAGEARGAISLRKQAVDSGYSACVEMDNVSISSISSLSLFNKLLRFICDCMLTDICVHRKPRPPFLYAKQKKSSNHIPFQLGHVDSLSAPVRRQTEDHYFLGVITLHMMCNLVQRGVVRILNRLAFQDVSFFIYTCPELEGYGVSFSFHIYCLIYYSHGFSLYLFLYQEIPRKYNN